MIEPQIKISELITNYPQVVDFLINEYQFHCIGCFVSEYETLEAGARVHGIVDGDFQHMLADLNKLVSNNTQVLVESVSPKKTYTTVAIHLPGIYLHGNGVTDFVALFAALQKRHDIFPETYIDTFNQLLPSYYIDELNQIDFWSMINEKHNLTIDPAYDWFGNSYEPRTSRLVQTYIDQLHRKQKRVIGIIDLGYDHAALLSHKQLIKGFDELYVSGEIGTTTRTEHFWERLIANENGAEQILLTTGVKKLHALATAVGIDSLLVRKADNVIAKLEEKLHLVS